MRNAANRVMAVAAVHERLYTGSDLHTIDLDVFLADLCANMGHALGCSDGLKADLMPVKISTDVAIPLALIVNELVTNAVKYGGASCSVSTTTTPDGLLTLMVSDSGSGPSADRPQTGMGSRMVNAFAKNLNAVVEQFADARGYTVKISVPLSKVMVNENLNRRGRAADSGLPRIAIPVSKLESGAQVPAFALAGAKRRTARTLAARSFLGPADDIRARSVAGQYCNAGASARSGLEPRGAS
jgi:hypothetical protein